MAMCSATGCPMPPWSGGANTKGPCYCAWHQAAHQDDMDAITAVFQRNAETAAAARAGVHEATVVLGGLVVRAMTRRKGDDR